MAMFLPPKAAMAFPYQMSRQQDDVKAFIDVFSEN